mmetsp:Transcript_10849/g.16362  ORF Transcript_10849/g.16362 Transcript_10849/m.16362 type:complete len:217 (-) Transcript_10849:55-705(-)|eukprot:CAMPEP_0201521314 /NCGR_PEP_ID=MMETSP0161_2-20130828/14348_1 /ASSEMBLY_ACC=CAM_ASM_000251 /TAXON_ID=180227 /ORGANISM="Neoparamoeba aestuarina, Strain SoJaBio B1-5/56/2" /LENGTH=216 /DNA_ID=CAMNT_0047919931 /DNA_START=39 /DNA_END=689 /DNA_ORIENTATION=-
MSKISTATLVEAIKDVYSVEKNKKREFNQSIDLQFNLKNYDPSKDKRFSGSVKLPHLCRPRYRVCVIGDAAHEEQAEKQQLLHLNMDDLKKLNKQKKLVKKFCNSYDAFLASDSVIKLIPKVVGPQMNRAGKFPTAVTSNDDLSLKVKEIQSTVKFQLKKVLCLGCCIGHQSMTEDEIRQNAITAINFLVSLLKKNWQNVSSIYIKSTMGHAYRLY